MHFYTARDAEYRTLKLIWPRLFHDGGIAFCVGN